MDVGIVGVEMAVLEVMEAVMARVVEVEVEIEILVVEVVEAVKVMVELAEVTVVMVWG